MFHIVAFAHFLHRDVVVKALESLSYTLDISGLEDRNDSLTQNNLKVFFDEGAISESSLQKQDLMMRLCAAGFESISILKDRFVFEFSKGAFFIPGMYIFSGLGIHSRVLAKNYEQIAVSIRSHEKYYNSIVSHLYHESNMYNNLIVIVVV